MSVLYLQFENGDRNTRVQKLGKSGAHIVPVEPRWPIFFELAKKEKPYAIAIDFSQAPSHCLETADYIAKAKETRETPLYLLRVPDDRLEAVKKRLPNAGIVTEQDLAGLLVVEEKKAQEEVSVALKPLVEKMKDALKDKAKDVRLTFRLTDSPSCLVADEGEMSGYLQRMLKAAGQQAPASRPILEVNPEHALVKGLTAESATFDDWCHLLFDQALLAEGGALEDPASFVKRTNALLLSR